MAEEITGQTNAESDKKIIHTYPLVKVLLRTNGSYTIHNPQINTLNSIWIPLFV